MPCKLPQRGDRSAISKGLTIQGNVGSSDLRLSDQERERALRDIREHFAAGRLTEEELSARVQAVYGARTQSALRALLADLPALPATRAEQKAEIAQRRSELQRRLLQQSGGGLVAFLICTGIWAAAGASGSFWPIWVVLVVLIPLVINGWRLYGPAPELDRVEHELNLREHRNRRHSDRREVRRELRAERRGLADRRYGELGHVEPGDEEPGGEKRGRAGEGERREP